MSGKPFFIHVSYYKSHDCLEGDRSNCDRSDCQPEASSTA